MAKIYGLSGVIVGKRANDVFAVTNGIQTVRAYQPIVANPRTQAQLEQRAKMNVTGRFTHLCNRNLLKAMQMPNNRMNRAAFNKGLLDVATFAMVGRDQFEGSIDASQVKFSRGAGHLKASVSTPFAATGTTATIGLTLSDAALANRYGERVILAVLDSDTANGPEMVAYKDVVFANTTAVAVSFDLPYGIVAGQRVIMWRVPIDFTEEGINVMTSGVAGTGSDITGVIAATNGLVREFGATSYVGLINFQ